MVVTPFHARTGLEVVERLRKRVKGRFDDVVRAGHVDRTVRVGEAQRLLRTQRPLTG
jgi:hypothetical protein